MERVDLLALLFPKKCVACNQLGSYFCSNCLAKIEYFSDQVCPECYKRSLSGKTHPYCQKQLGLDGVVSLTNYKTPVREFIQSLKYRFATDLLTEFSDKFVFAKDLLPAATWDLLPVPLHQSRQNYRGFNQAELLGEIVARKFGLELKKDVIERAVASKSQVGLTKTRRKANTNAVFAINQPVVGGSFYLFDDVWTSGATLKSAAKELKKAGAKSVWGLTLAHPRW